MHKLLPRAASVLDAAAPLLLSSPRVPALRLAGSPFLAARPGANPSRVRSPPWLCYDGARRRGLCSAEAARRGDVAEEETEKGVVGRAVPERRQRGRNDALVGSGELLAIPGVGPRNLRKLVDEGFDGVTHLKQLYRDKVAKFFEFVKKKKESSTTETIDGDKSISKQIMLPQSGGLWVPGNSPLPESALKTFDFRRTMSSFLST